MKTIFAHDHRFYRSADGKEILSKNAFDSSLWERYLEHTDELEVIARIFSFPEDAKRVEMTTSNHSQVTFQHIKETHTWKNIFPVNRAQKQIEQRVAKADAVIARLPSRIGSMAIKAAKKQGKHYMVEVVGDPMESYRHHGSKVLKYMATHAGGKMRKDVAEATHVLYVTQKDLQRKYPTCGERAAASNVEIESIDLEVYEKRKRKIKIQDVSKTVQIGMIGTLTTDYKGIDTAMDAIGKLKQQNRDVTLYILGPGDASKWLHYAEKVGVTENSVFCGILPSGKAIFDWIDKMDIYIQPSKTEGVPRALIEAMSRGCPAVGSSAGGIPELLSPNMIHMIGDSADLARKIDSLIVSRSKQLQEARKNLQTAAKYTKPILQKQRADLYHSFFKTLQ
ncbi:glycosyltransferase [Listeria cornellensis]|uniref:Group 1 glycosyl transferase n=1 Tax=Listeria cornellensis FSL F6-0969 TaxID=1265820 RepID=W7BYK8_9LIST|nr:glycosyltransferase [Listeria cornellensis]EUJ25288.1 group 1 glycosyl transferase [Listeria cornellensis FSL F6-0969]